MATMPASKLRLKPKSSAIGKKNGPMPIRMPTVNRVSSEAPATMFQPKYQLPTFDCVKVRLRFYFLQLSV
jgi:hypothetical protein